MNIKSGQNDYSIYADNRDVISLFSGAMGLDIGLGKAGLNIVIGQDFDVSCVKTMRENGHKVLGGDIREIEPSQPALRNKNFYSKNYRIYGNNAGKICC